MADVLACRYGGTFVPPAIQQRDDNVPRNRHHRRPVSFADSAGFLAESAIANPVQAVLDPPMAPGQGQQLRGPGLFTYHYGRFDLPELLLRRRHRSPGGCHSGYTPGRAGSSPACYCGGQSWILASPYPDRNPPINCRGRVSDDRSGIHLRPIFFTSRSLFSACRLLVWPN